MSRIGLVLGCSLLSVILLKSLEKKLSKNISNILILLVILGSIYLSVEINNSKEDFFYQDDNESVTTISSIDDNESVTTISSVDDNESVTTISSISDQEENTNTLNNLDNDPNELLNASLPDQEENTNTLNNLDNDSDKLLNASLPDQEENTNTLNNLDNEVRGASSFDTVNATVKPGSKEVPVDCYPQNILDAKDLLPHDKDSEWAKNSPSTKGALGDKNLLNAGFHIGVNTVGQSLRNANRQIRSEPPNPQVKVSPWLQSTIEPDINRKPLEIGCGEL